MKKALAVAALVAFSVVSVFGAETVGQKISGSLKLSGATSAPGQVKKTPSPSKSASAQPPAKSLTLTPNPMTITSLAPGISVLRTLTVSNANNQDVVLRSVKATVLNPSPPPVNGLSCTSPADFEVLVTDPGVVTISKNGAQDVSVIVRMNNSATRNQDGCKSKSFSFTFSATATSK